MYDQVPTDCAEIEIHVLTLGMSEHAAGIDLALARTGSIDNRLFEFVVPVFP